MVDDQKLINIKNVVNESGLVENIDDWVLRLRTIMHKVCHIEILVDKEKPDGKLVGTGFLIASNLVLTNFHVIESVYAYNKYMPSSGIQANPENLFVHFDYVDFEGWRQKKKIYKLKGDDWLVGFSKRSHSDAGVGKSLPDDDELDHAIIRLDGNAGDDLIEGSTEKRGYFTLSETYTFTENQPLMILHHSNGSPLMCGFKKQSVIRTNENCTRIWYDMEDVTVGGSGSPCLDIDLNLIAIHHGTAPSVQGDSEEVPESASPKAYQENSHKQGVPIGVIRKLISKDPKYLCVKEVLGIT